MALGLRKSAEIQEIQTESLYAQPQSSFKPVQAWALLGGAILAVQLYVWAKWVTGPYFVRVPSGPSDPPTLMKIVLVTWTSVICIGFPVGLYYFIIKPWRRERRITTDGMLMVAFGLLFFQDPMLNYFNTWCTYNTWLWNRGSWVLDIPGWVSWGKPGQMMAEPLLMNGPGYSYGVLLCTMLGCWVMRRAKLRWPSIGILGLLAVRVRVHLLLRRRDGGVLPDADGPLHVPRSHPVSLASSPAATTSTRSTRHSSGVPSRPDSALSASSRTIAAGPSSSAAWNASRVGS